MPSNAAPSPVIETGRLRLDPLGPDDAPAMSLALADPELYALIGGAPPTAEELTERIRRWNDGSPRAGEAWHNWAIRLRTDGTTIGHLQATVVGGGRAADIAWVVGTAWQGQGYASEAARALVDWLEAAGVAEITAHIHPGNVASARVATSAELTPTDNVEDGEVVWRRASPARHT